MHSLHKFIRGKVHSASWRVFFIYMLLPFLQISDKFIGNQRGEVKIGDDDVVDPPPIDPNALTMDQLKGIMQEVAKDSTKSELDALKQEILTVNRKGIFPEQDGDNFDAEVESVDKTILDTSFFYKTYSQVTSGIRKYSDAIKDGKNLGNQLINFGGPYKRLSPEMKTFANIIKCAGKYSKVASKGIKLEEYNANVKEHLKQAGMSEGVLADGGALVPVQFLATIIEFATAQSMILQKVWRLPMTSNIMRIPRLVQAAGTYFGGVQLYCPDEGEEKESTHPEFERLQFEAKKLIGLVYLTDELIADSPLNVINYVTGLMTRAFQYEVERRVIAGAVGAGPCLGIINDPSINIVARQTAGTIGYQDVVNLDSSLDENFNDLSWITRKATQNTLLGLRDLNNRPIFMADYGVFTGQPMHPNTMITYPVYRTRNVPLMGTKGDLILGDLSWYILAMRQDLTIDMSPHVRFIYDEQTLRFVMRLDGMPGISIAFSVLGDVES